MALTSETATLLDATLRQLSDRLSADASARLSFEAATNDRFLAVHEDARRDRRELMGRFDRFEDQIGQTLSANFEAVDARLKQVCDQGGEEHEAMRAELKQHEDRLDAQDLALAERRGRLQVARAAGKGLTWTLQNGWMLAFLLLALLSGKDYVLTAVANAMQPPAVTMSEALRGR